MPGTFRGENAYLHALSYDRLYHLVMADDPAGARAAGDWWQQTFHRLRAAETAIAECRRVTDGHLGGASGAAFRAGLDRLAAPIQLAQDNAHVWWAAADALVHAQAQMAELHEAGISAEGRRLQAVAIAYDLAERYTNLGLDLLPPVPQHGTARPEHRYGASISLAGHTSTPATTAPAAVL